MKRKSLRRAVAVLAGSVLALSVWTGGAQAFFCDIICLLQRYPVTRVDKIFDLKDMAQKLFDLKELYPDLHSLTDVGSIIGRLDISGVMNNNFFNDLGSISSAYSPVGDVTGQIRDEWNSLIGTGLSSAASSRDPDATPRQRVAEYYESQNLTFLDDVPGTEAEMVYGAPGVAAREILRGGRYGGDTRGTILQPYAVNMYADEARSRVIASIASIMAEVDRSSGGLEKEIKELEKVGDEVYSKVTDIVADITSGGPDTIIDSGEVLDAKILSDWAMLLASESGVRSVNNLCHLYNTRMMSRKIRMAGLIATLHTYEYANFVRANINGWVTLQQRYRQIYRF